MTMDEEMTPDEAIAVWPSLMRRGEDEFRHLRQKAYDDATYYQSQERVLKNISARPSIEFRPASSSDRAPFIVNIPPFRPNHFEGDAIAAPFGVTYWGTWDEAKEFFDGVIEGVVKGEYNEGWKP